VVEWLRRSLDMGEIPGSNPGRPIRFGKNYEGMKAHNILFEAYSDSYGKRDQGKK
jgi:hypothetical protein